MYKVLGSADTITAALDTIFGDFLPSEIFMVDQGRHFKNKKVLDFFSTITPKSNKTTL
jgi:hypothetical protein